MIEYLSGAVTVGFVVAATLFARSWRRTGERLFLVLTALLGAAFLAVKGVEYSSEWSEAAKATGGEARFYFLYFAMTGVHALHLAIGIGVVGWLALRAKGFSSAYYAPVEVTGLYWHFVDIVWVFLYPMFYLLERYR